MAKKKENFAEISKTELEKKLAGLREDLRVLRFKAEGSRSGNVKESLNLRKNIARVLTALNNK